MDVMEFLADYGSTTKLFKTWSDEHSLEVIEHGVVGGEFSRLVVIFVDKIPVMLGLSETKLSNIKFLDILQNVGITPIGVSLFAPNSGIKRINPFIGKIDTKTISNQTTKNYLVQNNVSGMIYYRRSNFVIDDEIMTLKEFILPGLNDILKQYT